MKTKQILIISIFLLYTIGIASAATNSTNPFSLGNAKVFWDNQDSEFQTRFLLVSGMFFFAILAVIAFSLSATSASYSAQKSGHFTDPEKKSGSATSIFGIVAIVLFMVLCLSFILPQFGF